MIENIGENCKNCIHSRNPVYPLPQGALSVHINGDNNHVYRYNYYSWMEPGLNRWEGFSFSAMPRSNISDLAKARQDLPLATPLWYDYTRRSRLTCIHYIDK